MSRNANRHPHTIPAPKGTFSYRDAVITFRHRDDGTLLADFRTSRWAGTAVAHWPHNGQFFSTADMYTEALRGCRFIR